MSTSVLSGFIRLSFRTSFTGTHGKGSRRTCSCKSRPSTGATTPDCMVDSANAIPAFAAIARTSVVERNNRLFVVRILVGPANELLSSSYWRRSIRAFSFSMTGDDDESCRSISRMRVRDSLLVGTEMVNSSDIFMHHSGTLIIVTMRSGDRSISRLAPLSKLTTM